MSLPRTLFAGSLALALGVAATARADVVVLVPNSTVKAVGGQVRGTIESETPTKVRVTTARAGGTTEEIPIDQIASINYDGQPASLGLARTNETKGLLAEAAEQYQKAAAEGSSNSLIARAAQFGQAHALAQLAMGDPSRANEAITLLEAFLRAHRNSRQFPAAAEALARLALQKGDLDRADRALTDLATVASAADRAAVLKARVQSRRGKPDEAIAALDRIFTGASVQTAKGREARLAKAEALAGLKRFDEAEALVNEVIKAAPPEDAEVQALAHNTLGDCLRAAGRPKDALFAYLHTDVLYAKDKEQHARALSQIVQLWRELKRDNRADETYERLKQEYPRSPWLAASTATR